MRESHQRGSHERGSHERGVVGSPSETAHHAATNVAQNDIATSEHDALDPLAMSLREQGRRERNIAPAGLESRIVSAWKVDLRESSPVRINRLPVSGAGRTMAAAACVLLVGAAAMLAKLDRAGPPETPAASMALSSSLRALPRPADSVARLASPLRREAALLSAETRRMLVGLNVLSRPRAGQPAMSPASGGGT